ncbi:MAG: nitroreductase family protein [Acidobacteria bacterium]|nr:nitroreductase family protein [Acidobacteriota bacterium]
MTVMEAIYGRRSVRDYTPAVVEESTVRALLDAAVQAPTAMHTEPWVFAVVQDLALLHRISDRARQMLPPALLSRFPSGFNIFYNASTLVVIASRGEGQFITADCWLAAENLMLAAHAFGLGTCCIGLALSALNAAETRRELALPAGVTAVAAIIVGHPATTPTPIGRKPAEVVSWRSA